MLTLGHKRHSAVAMMSADEPGKPKNIAINKMNQNITVQPIICSLNKEDSIVKTPSSNKSNNVFS